MKRMIASMGKRNGNEARGPASHDTASSRSRASDDLDDGPEAAIARNVRLFCESGSPNNPGDEILYLPTIVDYAESSPSAAASAASTIRGFLGAGTRSTFSLHGRSNLKTILHCQYNAIMLLRILSDNPGDTFTRNFDSKFVRTIENMLHTCKDIPVMTLLRQTLDTLERDKLPGDANLMPLITMWRKEKGQSAAFTSQPPPGPQGQPTYSGRPGPYQHDSHARAAPGPQPLPAPEELAARIEEARTTAQLLVQLSQSTPPTAFLSNDLIKEFAGRARSARDSVRSYIQFLTEESTFNAPQQPTEAGTAASSSGGSDNEATLITLLETNESLENAIKKYKTASDKAKRIGEEKPLENGATGGADGQQVRGNDVNFSSSSANQAGVVDGNKDSNPFADPDQEDAKSSAGNVSKDNAEKAGSRAVAFKVDGSASEESKESDSVRDERDADGVSPRRKKSIKKKFGF